MRDDRSRWLPSRSPTLPEVLLLAERLSRDVRREALRHIPGIRTLRLSHIFWVRRQSERYGPTAQTGWRLGYGLWRLVRVMLNPLQAAGQETSGVLIEKAATVLSYRLSAYATRPAESPSVQIERHRSIA